MTRRVLAVVTLILLDPSCIWASLTEKLTTMDGAPVSGAYVLYNYYVEGRFNPVQHMTDVVGGSILVSDNQGRIIIDKGPYSAKKAIFEIVYAPSLHNGSKGLKWDGPYHKVNTKAEAIALKDLTNDSNGWYESLGNLMMTIMMNITDPVPPERKCAASSSMQKEFINLYLSEATAFKTKYANLASEPTWKNRMAALDSQIKTISEKLKKL